MIYLRLGSLSKAKSTLKRKDEEMDWRFSPEGFECVVTLVILVAISILIIVVAKRRDSSKNQDELYVDYTKDQETYPIYDPLDGHFL